MSEARQSEETEVVAVILAAGISRRFGGRNKLLERLGDSPLVAVTVQRYLDAGFRPVRVVLGYEAGEVERALRGMAVETVINPRYRDGQGTSIAAGVARLPLPTQAVVIGVADQPHVRVETLRRMIEAYRSGEGRIVTVSYGDHWGAPSLFERSMRPELGALTGDRGARHVIDRHIKEVTFVSASPEEAIDIDTIADLRSSVD